MKRFTACLLAATVASTMSVTALAEDSASITEALKAGKTTLMLRARYEDVSSDETTLLVDRDNSGAVDVLGEVDGQGLTLLTRLSYTSGTFNGFGLTIEMDDITLLSDITDQEDFNGIADPEVTEVNQAFLSYKYGATTFKWGNQRINFDNQRFVGGVAWRQDEQTYSGFSAAYTKDSLSLFGGYITKVNRIFGEAQDHNHDSFLLNASYQTPFGKIVGYGYLLDVDATNIENENVRNTVFGFSTDTFGVRWEGKVPNILNYTLEYATQSDAGDNPVEFDADYLHAEIFGGVPIGDNKLNLKLGYESLGSDDGNAGFRTPLATLHKFQGWTDKFLATPAVGIDDTYFSIGSKFGPVTASVIYHDYSANEGSEDLGNELGLLLTGKVNNIGLMFKYSDYSAGEVDNDNFDADTTKFWLMATAKY